MRRVNLFCGHYGSGKTNIAVNFALDLKKKGEDVVIADLDIVNPYFRTKDSQEELDAAGIHLISSEYAGSNVDLPALPSEIYSMVENKNRYAVMDIGGDDRGAYALGRLTPFILEEGNYDMFFVVNFLRPLTRTAAEAHEVFWEIQSVCGIPFTGIINNTNLGRLTTAQTVLDSVEETERLCSLTGLPLVMTTVHESLYEELKGKVTAAFPMHLQKAATDL